MEIIPFAQFANRVADGRPNQMNMSPYVGHAFACACGGTHSFGVGDMYVQREGVVLRELSGRRLVFECPKSEHLTCVKLKGILRFKGFQSLFGTRLDDRHLQATDSHPALLLAAYRILYKGSRDPANYAHDPRYVLWFACSHLATIIPGKGIEQAAEIVREELTSVQGLMAVAGYDVDRLLEGEFTQRMQYGLEATQQLFADIAEQYSDSGD